LRKKTGELVIHAQRIEPLLVARGVDLSGYPRTETGLMSMTSSDLATLEDELALLVADHKIKHPLLTTLSGLLEHVHDGRLYGRFRQYGTRTGRMSSAEPNLQNLPKRQLLVRYFVRAEPGHVLVRADADSYELRMLAAYASGGLLATELAKPESNLHQLTGDAVAGGNRDIGKTVNTAITYGAGIRRIAEILGCNQNEAAAALERYYNLYPEVKQLQDRLRSAVKSRGFITTILGRRHSFERITDHRLLNRLVSGGCADHYKRGVVRLHECKIEVPSVLYVHDEIVCHCLEDDADRVGRELVAALTEPVARGPIKVDDLRAEAEAYQHRSQFREPDYIPTEMEWRG